MEERRLVHRGASVFDGEQERAVLDHLLEEDAFGRVEAVDREKRDDAGDRGDREEVADTVRVGTRGVRRVVRLHRKAQPRPQGGDREILHFVQDGTLRVLKLFATYGETLFEVITEDVEAGDARGIVAAPFGGRDRVGAYFAELEAAEEAGGALLGGACEDVLEAARARLLQYFVGQFNRDALTLEARESIEAGDFAGMFAVIRLGQQRADAGEMLVADTVAEDRG